MEFTGHDGLKLAAVADGPEGRATVLLAHGGGQTKRAWRAATDRLNGEGFRTVAIDLRGHGDSEWSADAAYNLSDFAGDMVSVVAQLGRKVAFVGASLGGLAGLIAEGELSPNTFSSLSLVDVTPRMDEEGAGRIGAFMSRYVDEGFASIEDAAAIIGDYTANREKRGASDGLKHYLRNGADGRYRWHWDPAFIRADRAKSIVATERLEQAARNLKIPVQLIRGQQSELVTEESVRSFLEYVPNARFDDVAGAGHMVVGDRNDVFANAIVDFLSGLDNAAPEADRVAT
jgi:pimeloyl-ACP methyl ester carboxylesterase